ncbi:uncharacterized protein LOC118279093 [Spodoptera frugiperda]|uniref:Uncharacterized protein LOC118279093 n=1 Tax=Spodoptera frugiperda TaxID=7108 RepID=A0A9R0DHY0_SPOFR|nr:uncharacterized protein LOC118279093 [Spodoptera frugiperda]
MATQPKPQPEVVELATVTVSSRIPEFWSDQPRLWFVQCEAVLGPQKLSDEARFNLVVTKLGKEVVQQVSDILLKPPETKKFEALKTRLLSVYEESETRQFQKLLGEMELGDQKPSQLLRRMKDLARDKVPDETLRLMWQGHLPSPVRAVLAVTEVTNLDNLAVIADKVIETSKPLQVSEVQTASNTNNDQSYIIAELAKLSMKIRDMERGRNRVRNFNRPFNRRQSRSMSRGRNLSRRTPDSPDWLCHYHFKFHNRARKCVEPCAWKKNEQNKGN